MTETIAAPQRAALEPPWKQHFRAPRIMFPSWARDDADRLLFLTNASGKFEVHTWDRRTGATKQLTDRSEGTGYRVPARLEPDGRRVWWFDDAKGNELGRWVRVPFEGGAPEEMTPELEPAYSAWLALGTGFAVIGRSRSDEGTTAYLRREGKPLVKLYAHPQSASIGDLSRDERWFVLSHSEHGDSRNRALRVLDLEGKTIADKWDGEKKGLESGRWSPVKGDGRLIVLHERTGVARPIVWDVPNDRETDVALDLPGEVSAEWYPDAKALLISHDHRGRTELYRYDLATRAATRLDTERGTIAGARVRPDGQVWYMLDRSSEQPVVRAVGGDVVLRPTGAPAPRGVAYRDADVEGIHVFVAEPPGKGPHPTYFFIHGGPSAHDRDSFSPTVQAWVDHGIAVVMVNYRGSSGYGKAWRDAIVGRPGLTELEDIAKVQDWAVRSGIADPKRTLFGGGSWGGYLTLLALGTQPERWALGIGIVPIGDYIAAFEDEMEPLKRYDAALFGGYPNDVPDSYRRSNPLTYAENVRAPMFLLVGQNDPRCPSRSVDVYEERLRELGKPYEEYRYDAGHGSLKIDESLNQVAMEIDFVAKHLGTTPAR
ncbi:MAG TPA: prolyl oligopeptidase family serine peptidase [Candidatus Acidoferrales bacterium]|nr:prolyl oligopeptidase family serine peptidase [Candidatus Acidoferrales bacterium]